MRPERLGLGWVLILNKARVNEDLEVSNDGRLLPICALACQCELIYVIAGIFKTGTKEKGAKLYISAIALMKE